MATVALRNIRKEFDGHIVAVDNFTLDVQDKEFIVLVGPSGCGKTTTLYMIAGLEDVSSGEIYIDGKLMNEVESKDRDIAMVFQNYALYPHLTVEKNLEFPLRMHKTPKKNRMKKIAEVAEILEISELLKRKPHKLSGGQQQRVAIGKAIIREPKLFLMDEPLANLDVFLRNQMRVELIRLHKKLGATFIYVTHDQVEALTLGTRIVVMKDGYIQQTGTPQDVFNNPSNVFVASFIGLPKMNFIPGCSLIERNGQFYIRLFEKELLLDEKKQTKLQKTADIDSIVTVGIRPDKFTVVERGMFTAIVEVSEFIGTETYLHLSIGNVRDLIVKTSASMLHSEVKAVDLLVDPSALYLFNQNTNNLMNDSEDIKCH